MAIAAIFRNEGPYILEWVAHHRCLGIERMFIADNNSTDGSTALLAALDQAGLIRHIPFPGVEGMAPQLSAYEEIMRRHKSEADWVIFIDGDEFLRPMKDGFDIAQWLGSLPRDVGSVAVNWANYGSSHRELPGEGLVHERFTMRAPDDYKLHATFKSIVRSVDWRGTVGHPHRFAIPENRRFVDTRVQRVDIKKGAPGQSMRISWDVVRIDHFIVKSKWEFLYKKKARGRGAKANAVRPDEFFTMHDRNEVSDPLPASMRSALKAEMEAIRSQLADLPQEARDLDQRLDQIGTL